MQALLALALLQLCGAPAGLARAERRSFSLLKALRTELMTNNDDYSMSALEGPDPPLLEPAVSRVNEPVTDSNRPKLSASSLIQNWNHSLAGRFAVIRNPDHPGDPRVPTLDVGFSLRRNETGELRADSKEDKQAFGYREETRGSSAAGRPYVTQQVYEVGSHGARADPAVGFNNLYLSR